MTTTKKERQLTFIKKVTCTPMFSAAILLTAKEATQIPVNRETDKPNSFQTMGNLSTISMTH